MWVILVIRISMFKIPKTCLWPRKYTMNDVSLWWHHCTEWWGLQHIVFVCVLCSTKHKYIQQFLARIFTKSLYSSHLLLRSQCSQGAEESQGPIFLINWPTNLTSKQMQQQKPNPQEWKFTSKYTTAPAQLESGNHVSYICWYGTWRGH